MPDCICAFDLATKYRWNERFSYYTGILLSGWETSLKTQAGVFGRHSQKIGAHGGEDVEENAGLDAARAVEDI